MHRTIALLFWKRCVSSVGRLRHQSFVTATVRERSQRTDGLIPLRSLLWDRSVPTYKRATPYHFLRLPLSQKWRCSCVKAMLRQRYYNERRSCLKFLSVWDAEFLSYTSACALTRTLDKPVICVVSVYTL